MCCRKLVTLRHVALSQPVIVVALPLIRLEASVCGGEGGGSRGGDGQLSRFTLGSFADCHGSSPPPS
jgi:hypothetical protein